jgi:hypothetical protein
MMEIEEEISGIADPDIAFLQNTMRQSQAFAAEINGWNKLKTDLENLGFAQEKINPGTVIPIISKRSPYLLTPFS